MSGEDTAYDVFNGGSGTDTIQGGDQNDTIRVHEFEGENRVEIIDGGGDDNTLAGTDQGDTIDLTETQLRNIQSIELEGGDDTLRLSYESLENLSGSVTIDGGAGRDAIRGSNENDLLDLSNTDIKNIESVDLREGDDFVFVSESADGPEEYHGGTGDDYIVGDAAGRGLQIDGGGGIMVLFHAAIV